MTCTAVGSLAGAGTPSLLVRHETPNFDHKGHLVHFKTGRVRAPQTSLVIVAEPGSPRMEDSLPGHRPPQEAARKSCETIVEFKNNFSQRKPCQLAKGPRQVDAAASVLYFPRSYVCACVHEPGDIAAGGTHANGFQSITSKPAPLQYPSWLGDGVASAWLSCHPQSVGLAAWLIKASLTAVAG